MEKSSEIAIANSAAEEYTRLHITPLTPNLLRAILPPSVLPNARKISYHTIATFPEKGYGYLELPVMDAEKVKKKLSGTILKGSKIRIEKARLEKKFETEQVEEVEVPKKQKKNSKKRKRGDDTIPGAEIGERSVKRGWTTPVVTKTKDKEVDKKKIKSKYTTGPECLFKTVVPPNVATTSKVTEKPDKKKRGKPGKETVVHEFSKTTKYPTFLKSTSNGKKAVTAEFVEGKGWVDEEGNVVDEMVKTSKKAPGSDKPKRKKKEPTPESVAEKESSSSESNSSDSDNSSDDEPETEPAAPVIITSILKTARAPAPAPISESIMEKTDSSSSEPSSSDSGSGSGSDDSADEENEIEPAAPVVLTSILKAAPDSISERAAEDADSSMSEPSSDDSDSTDSLSSDEESEKNASVSATESVVDSRPVSRPQSSSGPLINLSIKIPSPPTSAEIHPLEALYKRPKPGTEAAPKPATESFSFFGADDPQNESEAEEATGQVPLTPYTQKDFEFRGMRSAAPTPDTAHANKRFLWPSSHDDDEEDDHVPSSPIRGKTDSKKPVKTKFTDKAPAGNEKKEEESDFQKWFYEHRGDTNRAWKKRRRVAGKEKRHRENKKRSDRAI
jgi:hypothetical protein